MNDLVIRATGIGKKYRLGVLQPYKTMRDVIAGLPAAIRGQRGPAQYIQEKWALRDIDLELREGEVLGIIGRNGSGKSTLLKILARITEPTTGRAEIRGRVGALLEVGTGFHPELTGRENIFVNGAIIGMTRAEIARKFDQIVDFSGVEAYLDTPVKRYSSGMRVRLAFATAAHLEPEILLIDEVLAVGDAEFQRKCLGRMQDVAAEGRTVLFVSHQLDTILGLCSRVVVLDQGRILTQGNTSKTVQAYLSSTMSTASTLLTSRQDRIGEGPIRIDDIEVTMLGGSPNVVSSGAPIDINLHYSNAAPGAVTGPIAIFAGIRDGHDQLIATIKYAVPRDGKPLSGRGVIRCAVADLPLMPGQFTIEYSIRINTKVSDKLFRARSFEVTASSADENSFDGGQGVVLLRQNWTLNETQTR